MSTIERVDVPNLIDWLQERENIIWTNWIFSLLWYWNLCWTTKQWGKHANGI